MFDTLTLIPVMTIEETNDKKNDYRRYNYGERDHQVKRNQDTLIITTKTFITRLLN